jgi:hypothetical protein
MSKRKIDESRFCPFPFLNLEMLKLHVAFGAM